MELPDTAPKTIDQIGDRTFRVKERMWAINTIGNLKYIWCRDVLNGTGAHKDNAYPGVFPEIQMLQKRGEQLAKQKEENKHEMNPEQTDKDIESINKQIADFRAKECPECIRKYEFRLDKVADTNAGECVVLGAGPSLLDKDDNVLPKMSAALKRSSIPIVVCDRSLIPILKEGIIPKYVVAADGVDHVIKYFKHDLVKQAIKEHNLVAIFNVQIHPSVSQLWCDEYGGKVMWYNVALDEVQKGKSLSRYLFHMTNDNVISVPWGHVAAYCFGLGYLIGYNPIIFLGVDTGFRVNEDPIEDTPYWNPYFKAIVREHILKQVGVKMGDKVTPEKEAKFKEFAKKIGYDDLHEYMAKDKEFYEKVPELHAQTIKEHFHFYTNPFGNKVYHDNIFKAYKDIMFSFFVANPRAKIIQCSEYTSWFPIPCDACKGKKQINQINKTEKECFKCHTKHIEESVGSLVPCPQCLVDTDKKNEKGEAIYEPCGIKGNSIECIDFNDYLNRRLEKQTANVL